MKTFTSKATRFRVLNSKPYDEYYKVHRISTLSALIHEYIVDVFGCLIPGSAFLIGIGIFLRFNIRLISEAIGVKTDILTSYANDLVKSVQENMLVYLMLAYVIGMLFNRRSLQQPDSISQIIRALDRSYKTSVVPVVVYFLICSLGSIKKFIYEFNVHIRETCDWCFEKRTCGYQAPEGGDLVDKLFLNGGNVQGMLVDEVDINKMDIARGKLKIGKCVLDFLKREVRKYVASFLIILTLIFGAYVAEMIEEQCWPYGVGIALLLDVLFLKCFPKVLRVFFSVKREVRWRDCPRKDPGRVANRKEAYNRCGFLKSQLTRYPYEDFFDVYILLRDCPWLGKYGWSRNNAMRKLSSLRMIESMKLRLYQIAGHAMSDVRRIEAQIRLIGTIWYMSKFFITTCWCILFLIISYKLIRDLYWSVQPVANFFGIKTQLSIFSDQMNVLAYFYRNLFLFIVAFFINYSSASFLHFLRLKEVHHILELFHFYVKRFKGRRSSSAETTLFEEDFQR